jgi:hypothetical protein
LTTGKAAPAAFSIFGYLVERACDSVWPAAGAGGFVAVEEDAQAVEGEHVVDLGVLAAGLRTSG